MKTALAGLILLTVCLAACGAEDSDGRETMAFEDLNLDQAEFTRSPEGLEYFDLQVGDGPEAAPGQVAVVHYTGWLEDGTKFDSSRDRNQTFSFPLGRRQVIDGWDLGVAGMRVGGKRVLRIPPELGYGATGAGGVIPPNATLIFEVELVGSE